MLRLELDKTVDLGAFHETAARMRDAGTFLATLFENDDTPFGTAARAIGLAADFSGIQQDSYDEYEQAIRAVVDCLNNLEDCYDGVVDTYGLPYNFWRAMYVFVANFMDVRLAWSDAFVLAGTRMFRDVAMRVPATEKKSEGGIYGSGK